LFHAEQNELLVRPAADSGARRGEPAALRVDDVPVEIDGVLPGVAGELV
jgi:hypothetical protein